MGDVTYEKKYPKDIERDLEAEDRRAPHFSKTGLVIHAPT